MLTKEQVTQHLGELDDLMIARIIETGVTESELQAVVQEFRRDAEFGEETHERPKPAITHLLALLEEIARTDRDVVDSAFD
jgi:hypothetical protein